MSTVGQSFIAVGASLAPKGQPLDQTIEFAQGENDVVAAKHDQIKENDRANRRGHTKRHKVGHSCVPSPDIGSPTPRGGAAARGVCGLAQTPQCDGNICHANRKAPFVVIPRQNADHALANDFGLIRRKDRGMLGMVKVDRYF